MKLFAIYLLYKAPDGGHARIFKSATELTSFGFFQRGSVDEFMKFTVKIITERPILGQRARVHRARVCAQQQPVRVANLRSRIQQAHRSVAPQ